MRTHILQSELKMKMALKLKSKLNSKLSLAFACEPLTLALCTKKGHQWNAFHLTIHMLHWEIQIQFGFPRRKQEVQIQLEFPSPKRAFVFVVTICFKDRFLKQTLTRSNLNSDKRQNAYVQV